MLRVKQTAVVFCFACLLGGAARAATETVLHNFAMLPKGSNPQSGVIGDPAGTDTGLLTRAALVTRGSCTGLTRQAWKRCCTVLPGRDGGQPQRV